ncbi:MAG: site-2 protease family protein, partial [Parcubacteria group bacterium]|nr:site-2 protease family protein [Parcubacteria group bacterium]
PFNPLALRNQRWGPALVAIAGPFSNIFLAFVLSVVFRGFLASGNFSALPFLAAAIYLNIVLAVFNLVPIPPLDGSRILTALLPRELQGWSYTLEAYGLFLVILFIVFGIGLIQPIFPLFLRIFAGEEAIFALSRFLQFL